MAEVILHIYDVTNSSSDKTNSTIVQINKIFKDGIGFGGIFHSAVQVLEDVITLTDFYATNNRQPSLQHVYGDEEWSFGFCEQGTGVFSCPAGENPMYTYRECMVLGRTDHSIFKVNQILRELSRVWSGHSYDLLSKNCNHFCDEFCEQLGVPQLPGWVNRFAHAGDAAVEIAGTTAERLGQAKTEIISASKVAYRFLAGVASNNPADSPASPGSSTQGTPIFQATWFKNLMSAGAKPSSSSDLENRNESVLRQPEWEDAEAPPRQNSHNL